MTEPVAIPVITVDGPGGVGKGTVARWISKRLMFNRLDSGALYRLAAIAALDRGIGPDAADRIAALCHGLSINFGEDADGHERITLDSIDVTQRLRLEATGEVASHLSVWPAVRNALLQRQRNFRQRPGLVADGRDMGTVVFTDARLKLFLDADVRARALRRQRQLSESGIAARIDDLCVQIAARDARDRNRIVAPLRAANDAITIDTSNLSVAEVEERVETLLAVHGFT
ncbi:MAG: (d)CMP kinase [Nevskiaceae bacterium]|nr:MAG: (d)CMP kinase [Nevskiaceae bacterium]TBR74891.1 MAG: (d)CMP kinase [Nevskiaceae bacterium]